MTTMPQIATLIGTTYVVGLAMLGVVMLIRGRDGGEVDGASFPSLLDQMQKSGDVAS